MYARAVCFPLNLCSLTGTQLTGAPPPPAPTPAPRPHCFSPCL